MTEVFVGATVLIVTVSGLRRITMGRISMGMRYGLWLMVAARLVIPVNFGNSSVSVMVPVQGAGEYVSGIMETAPDKTAAEGGSPIVLEKLTEKNENREKLFRKAALGIWITGILVAGGSMMMGQARLLAYLRRTREEVPVDRLPDPWFQRLEQQKLRVYTVPGLPSPCIAGRSIYLLPETLQGGEGELAHILAHEYAHEVQKDILWAAVRSLLCVIYWFHPLVWAAAYGAKQDSELAADEKAIRLLGESERYAYGRTLLGVWGSGYNRSSYTGVVLTMNDSGKRMKERVLMIADKKKKSSLMAGVAVLIMLLACGCSFTGAKVSEADVTEIKEMGIKETDTEEADIKSEEVEEALILQVNEIVAGMNVTAETYEENSQEMKDSLERMKGEWEQAVQNGEEEEQAYLRIAIEAYEKKIEEAEEGLRIRMDMLEEEKERLQRELDQISPSAIR